MLKNENIICISSIDWDFAWQGHQEVMSTFANNGNRVLFIENTGVRTPGIKDIPRLRRRVQNWFKGIKGIRKEAENLYIFSPLILPFPYSRLAGWINRHLILSIIDKWTRVMDFNDPIIWTFLPTGLALDLIDNIQKKLVVYYCIADFEKLVKNPDKIRKSEIKLAQKADLIFAQGQEIKRRLQNYNSNISIFPFGVNLNRFNNDSVTKERFPEMSNINGMVLGYIGGIHKHIDFGLVRFIAERNPDWTLLFVGPVQTDVSPLQNLPNIKFLQMKEHKDLARYVDSFNVGLIPYALNEYTKTVYPTKLNEYLAMGKAVVSTALPEVIAFNNTYDNVVYAAKNNEEFEKDLKTALEEDNPPLRKRRIDIARENSWQKRIENMSKLMEKKIEQRKLNMDSRWREELIVFYRRARRKALRLGAILILSYLLIFKTAFVWFLAGPLSIADIPQRSDVIVVFGGGVGETGSPGKSTIERARYAAQLYHEGYSDKIIFSSGYTFTYNDAENMRLIALSAGVPDKDIILEQKANSTYENVISTRPILYRKKWDSILLVSSPYNMRRASLVFNKQAEDIKVFYTPVKNPQFYSRAGGVKLEQIKAIMHEYLGILYYFWKGYS